MKKKRWFALFLALILVFTPATATFAESENSDEAEVVESSQIPEEGNTSPSPLETDINQTSDEAARRHFSYYDQVPVILIADAQSGKILFEKNADRVYPVASMSKLMTYYIAKKAIADGEIREEDEVTISPAAAALNVYEYSNYGLKVGERLTVKDLLKGLMVVSGNDAAEALAEYIETSKDAFVRRMNETAREMGLAHSHFVNPHGITEGQNKNEMSAMDLFTLAKRIIQEFPETLDYAKIKEISEPQRGYKEESTLVSGQLASIAGVDGLKTGMTEEAGYCFTGTVNMKEVDSQLDYRIISVIMGCDTAEMRWRTMKEVLDYTAGSFQYQSVVNSQVPIMKLDVPSAEDGYVELYPQKDFRTLTYQNVVYQVKYAIDKQIKAPLETGQSCGEITVLRGQEIVDTIPIIVKKDVNKAGFFLRMERNFEGFFGFIANLL